MFDDEEATAAFFEAARWPNGVACPHCGSLDIRPRPNFTNAPYRCRDCPCNFSVKTGSVMHGSNVPLGAWGIALYLIATSPVSVPATRIAEYTGVAYRTAWYMNHRIREGWEDRDMGLFCGPVEVDETFVGGTEANRHRSKKAKAPANAGYEQTKTPVVGVLDRPTNQVVTAVVERTDGPTLKGFVLEHMAEGARIFTDGATAYRGLPNHEWVEHSNDEYVRGDVHTNGAESFWSRFKGAVRGTFRYISPKHTWRYAAEFGARHNAQAQSFTERMRTAIARMGGRRLPYEDLAAPPEPSVVVATYAPVH